MPTDTWLTHQSVKSDPTQVIERRRKISASDTRKSFMARNILGQSPYPISLCDGDLPLTQPGVSRILTDHRQGTSLLIRSSNGPANRGGYYFHVCLRNDGRVTLKDFSGVVISEMSIDELTRFINHATGRIFDEEMFQLSVSHINFRQD